MLSTKQKYIIYRTERRGLKLKLDWSFKSFSNDGLLEFLQPWQEMWAVRVIILWTMTASLVSTCSVNGNVITIRLPSWVLCSVLSRPGLALQHNLIIPHHTTPQQIFYILFNGPTWFIWRPEYQTRPFLLNPTSVVFVGI